MQNKKLFLCILSVLFFIGIWTLPCVAYVDETHLLIAKAAGYKKWYNAAAADIVKVQDYNKESPNHFVDNRKNEPVTAQLVRDQVGLYNNENDKKGHLYGAILATVRESIRIGKNGKYFENVFAYCAHYVGDLSMPLHNIVYNEDDPNDFNAQNHTKFEIYLNNRFVKNLVLEGCNKKTDPGIIDSSEIPIESYSIKSEEELVQKIAKIAEEARILGYKLEKDKKRNMNRKEFLEQMGKSASLLKAIMTYIVSQGAVFEKCYNE